MKASLRRVVIPSMMPWADEPSWAKHEEQVMIDKSGIPEHDMRDAGNALIEAAKEIAAVVQHGGMDDRQTANFLEAQDPQGFPFTFVVMSPTVIKLLRALDGVLNGEAARDALIRDRPQTTPTYGPKRHQGE